MSTHKVNRLLSGSGRTARVPTNVDGSLVGVVFSRLESGVQPRLDIAPRSGVQGLLLSPDNVGVGELVNVRREEVVREGRDLLDSADNDVVEASVLSVLDEGLVNLT